MSTDYSDERYQTLLDLDSELRRIRKEIAETKDGQTRIALLLELAEVQKDHDKLWSELFPKKS